MLDIATLALAGSAMPNGLRTPKSRTVRRGPRFVKQDLEPGLYAHLSTLDQTPVHGRYQVEELDLTNRGLESISGLACCVIDLKALYLYFSAPL